MSPISSRVTEDRQAPLLIAVGEVGRLTGLSRPTVYRLSREGRMPLGIRVGRSIRWKLEEIVRWASDGCPASGVGTGVE